MIARFWVVRKRINSTYVPPAGGVETEINLKENSSALRPTLIMQWGEQNASANYFWLSYYNRYYFITETTWLGNNLIEVTGEVDPLATYRSQILERSVYVERAAVGFNKRIPDLTMLPKHGYKLKGTKSQFCPTPSILANDITGQFVVGVIGQKTLGLESDAVSYYCLNLNTMNELRSFLFDEGNYAGVLTDDVVKSFFNPFQYIVSAYYLPDVYLPSSANDTIRFGWFGTDALKGYRLNAKVFGEHVKNWTLNIPRANADGAEFVNFSPYSVYKLYIPFFGTYDISPDVLYNYDQIRLDLTLDIPTGAGFMKVSAIQSGGDRVTLYRFTGQVGSPVQLAQTTIDIMGAVQGTTQAITGAVSAFSNPIGGVTQAFSGVANAATSMIPSKDSIGANGCRAYAKFDNDIDFQLRYMEVTGSDLSTEGRPLGEERVLGGFSGYVKCSDASISINSAFKTEMEMINNFLNGGVYIE